MAAVEGRHWWFVSRRRLFEELLRSCLLPDNPTIVELGCGTGVVSIAAAAAGAATVTATDICPTCLGLTNKGWQQTQRHQQQQQQEQQGEKSTFSSKGTLQTQILDVCSTDPLPGSPTLVVAGAVLYDAVLAQALARRVAQAAGRCDHERRGAGRYRDRQGGARGTGPE